MAASAAPASARGPITSFGSIFVNGVEWETDQAEIEMDDRPAFEEALRLGMVVRVEGTLSADGQHGVADRVVFDDVEGPIDATPLETIDGLEKRFTVLGRSVIVEVGFTTFDGTASYDELERGDMVEVSGLIDPDGHIRATRIEGHDASIPAAATASCAARSRIGARERPMRVASRSTTC